jgi:hypothetical protein
MRKNYIAFAAMILPLASRSGAEVAQRVDRPLPEYSLRLAENIVFEIDPRIELLAGVQSLTSWVGKDGRPPQRENSYFSALQSRFEPLAKSKAAKASQAFTDMGFTYDAPCSMVLSLDGGEAFRAPAEGWSDYLKSRGRGVAKLEAFRAALAVAYDESSFASFLAEHEADYRRWLAQASEGFDAKAVSAWLEGFYGAASPPVYHFVFAPAMFPGGGYGFGRTIGSGASKRLHVFQIVRAQGAPDGEPKRLHVFQIVRAQGAPDGEPGFPSGTSLAALGLHEFSHSFVNPALEKGSGDRRLKKIFDPVSAKMRSQAYPTVASFLNELVIRAATIVGMRDLGLIDEKGIRIEARDQRSLGFYPIERVIALLEEYDAKRGAYPDFARYAPALLERLASEADAIVAEGAMDGFGGVAKKSLKSVAAFSEGFEAAGAKDSLKGFAVNVGARISGGEGEDSRMDLDPNEASPGAAGGAAKGAARGASSFRLEADSSTTFFRCLQKPIAVKKGKLTLSYSAKGEDIRKEGSQFGGSYVGFIIVDKSGGKHFSVKMHSGSFPWGDSSLSVDIDSKQVSAIDFTIFLNESGKMWVDDVKVAYE